MQGKNIFRASVYINNFSHIKPMRWHHLGGQNSQDPVIKILHWLEE